MADKEFFTKSDLEIKDRSDKVSKILSGAQDSTIKLLSALPYDDRGGTALKQVMESNYQMSAILLFDVNTCMVSTREANRIERNNDDVVVSKSFKMKGSLKRLSLITSFK